LRLPEQVQVPLPDMDRIFVSEFSGLLMANLQTGGTAPFRLPRESKVLELVP